MSAEPPASELRHAEATSSPEQGPADGARAPDTPAAGDQLLPPELFAHIGSFLAPASRNLLKLMLASRFLYELLLPRLMSRVRLEWFAPETVLDAVDRLRRRGALVHVKDLDLRVPSVPLYHDAPAVYLESSARILGSCSGLRELSATITTFPVAAAFSEGSFPQLCSLDLTLQIPALPEPRPVFFRRFPPLPSLRALTFRANYCDIGVLGSIEACSPLLEEAHIAVPLFGLGHALAFPRSLLRRTLTWQCSTLEQLRLLANFGISLRGWFASASSSTTMGSRGTICGARCCGCRTSRTS